MPQSAPQCFSRVGDLPPQCLVRSEYKEDCGFMHITKQQCLDRVACCFAKADQSGVPWCYRKKQSAVQQVKVACVGGSITAGDLNKYTHYAYPLQLQEVLGTEDFYVGNFGVDGATVMQAGLHHQKNASSWYKITQAFKRVISFKPDIVITQFVDNDSRDVNWINDANITFVRDYIRMVDWFLNLSSKPKVLIMRPPPLYVDGRYGMNQRVCNKVIPDLLAHVRQARNLPPIVDVYSAFEDHCPVARNTVKKHNCTWIATDKGLPLRPGFEGVHPTDPGNKAIAVVVAKAIRALHRPMMHTIRTTLSADAAMETSKTTPADDALMPTSKTSPLAETAADTSTTTPVVGAATETSTVTHVTDAAMDTVVPTLSAGPLADTAENAPTTTSMLDAATSTSTSTHAVDVVMETFTSTSSAGPSADAAMETSKTTLAADALMHTSKTRPLAQAAADTSTTTPVVDAAMETSTLTHATDAAMDTFMPTHSADVAMETSTTTPVADVAIGTSKTPYSIDTDMETSHTTSSLADTDMETFTTAFVTDVVVEIPDTTSSDEASAITRVAPVSNATTTVEKKHSTEITRFS